MNLAKYQELTGITVPSSQQAQVTAQIKRTRIALENMLGYSLESKKASENQYEELGKTQSECGCDDINIDNLNDPDEVQGAYRLFSYNENDLYLPVDPFTTLYKVKLVVIRPGEDQGVTVKTFDDENLRVVMKNGFAKYIEVCKDCFCTCSCQDCVQLAVDADWMFEDCLPLELQYLWADMVTYESDQKKDLKSETLGSHSYTRFDRLNPAELSSSMKVLQKYAGPNGSLDYNPTI